MSFQPLLTPWGKIIKSMPMWSLIIVHLTQNWGFWILLTNMPTYINYILKFNIKSVRLLRNENVHIFISNESIIFT